MRRGDPINYQLRHIRPSFTLGSPTRKGKENLTPFPCLDATLIMSRSLKIVARGAGRDGLPERFGVRREGSRTEKGRRLREPSGSSVHTRPRRDPGPLRPDGRGHVQGSRAAGQPPRTPDPEGPRGPHRGPRPGARRDVPPAGRRSPTNGHVPLRSEHRHGPETCVPRYAGPPPPCVPR